MGRATTSQRFGRGIVGALLALLATGLPGLAAPVGAQGAPTENEALRAELARSAGGGVEFKEHAVTGAARFVGTSAGRPIPRAPGVRAGDADGAARGFLSKYSSLFGVDDAASLVRTRVESSNAGKGASSVRFQQTIEGVPVLAGDLVVQVDGAGNVRSAGGETTSADVGSTAVVTAAEAGSIAREVIAKHREVAAAELTVGAPALHVYDPALLTSAPGKPALVWKTEVRSSAGDMRELVLVDAVTGGVPLHFDQLAFAKNRVVCDYANVPSASYACTSGFERIEGSAPFGQVDVDLAYDYAGHTYDYFFSKFGRDSLNGAGMTLVSSVRWCDPSEPCPYDNAFWDGAQMVYGEGYAAADDVVAHELTHGVTEFSNGLFYYFQSGAINEAISDIFGEYMDLQNGAGTDTVGVRWLMGEDIPGGAIRSMSNPPAFGDPDRMQSANYVADTGLADSGGVHTNSGVANKAAFLMVDGATFNGVTVTGLGVTKAERIWYEVETNFLTSGSDYQDLHEYLRQACTNLVGTVGITSNDCLEVTDAVNATQMHLQPTTANASAVEAPVCETGIPLDMFADGFESINGNWNGSSTGGSPWQYATGYASRGDVALYSPDNNVTSDNKAIKATAVVPPAGNTTYLHFRHAYDFENGGWDGGVLEYSTNGGANWIDAGSLFTHQGYNGTLQGANPMGVRSAFINLSRGYISSRVNLTTLAGQNVLIRFRAGSDSTIGDLGWLIDDLRIYTCSPLVSVADASIAEGNAGTSTLAMNVTLSKASNVTTTVPFTVSPVSAANPSDYTVATSSPLVFAPGVTTLPVNISVVGDTGVEPDETLTVDLGSPTNAVINDGQGIGTITNDDVAPAVGSRFVVDNVVLTEGDAGTSPAAFTVSRTAGTGSATVTYATASISANAGGDYTSIAPTVLTFNAGETTKVVNVDVKGETIPEQHEQFALKLTSPSAGSVIGDDTGVGTITDNDAGTPASLVIDDVTIAEGDAGTAVANLTVTRVGTTAEVVTVKYTTSVAVAPWLPTANAPSDYTSVPTAQTLTFAAGDVTKIVPITINGDVLDEQNESLFVRLREAGRSVIADDIGVITIIDNEGAPISHPGSWYTIDNVRLAEGNAATTNASFTVTRGGNTAGTTTVQYSTASVSANAGGDYTSVAPTTLTFNPGETTKPVVILVKGETIPEQHEQFAVKLTNAGTGTYVRDDTGVGTITNDDAGAPATFAIDDVSITEGTGGTSLATFTVTRSGTSAEVATVKYTTSAAVSPFLPTANAPSDYTSVPTGQTLTFAAGELTKPVSITIQGDALNESDEFFFVRLREPGRSTIADDIGVGTIIDDE